MDALAAVRRLSFAALSESDPETYPAGAGARADHDAWASHQVHLVQLAQDGSLGRGNCYRPSRDGTPVPGPEYVLEFDEASAVHRVSRTGRPFNAPDAANAAEVNQRLVQTFNVASALFVPLAFEGEVRLVAVLVSETPAHLRGRPRAAGLHAGKRGHGRPGRDGDARQAERARGAAGRAGPGSRRYQRPAGPALGAEHALPGGGSDPGGRPGRRVPGQRRDRRAGGGRSRDARRLRLVRVRDQARRGRERAGAGHGQAGRVERLSRRGPAPRERRASGPSRRPRRCR